MKKRLSNIPVKYQVLIAMLIVVATPFTLTAVLPAKVLLDVLPIFSTIFLSICYVPQIWQNYKTKNVEGQNFWFWLYLNIALTLLLTNAYTIWGLYGTYGYLVTEILNEGFALVTFTQFLLYKKK